MAFNPNSNRSKVVKPSAPGTYLNASLQSESSGQSSSNMADDFGDLHPLSSILQTPKEIVLSAKLKNKITQLCRFLNWPINEQLFLSSLALSFPDEIENLLNTIYEEEIAKKRQYASVWQELKDLNPEHYCFLIHLPNATVPITLPQNQYQDFSFLDQVDYFWCPPEEAEFPLPYHPPKGSYL